MEFMRNETVTYTLTGTCKRNKIIGNAIRATNLQPFKSNTKT